MVKYVKYVHFFITTVELGCNETQEESLLLPYMME